MSGTIYVLSNLGTPAAPTEAAVGAFLAEFLSDPAVIPLPAWLRLPLVRWMIVPRRAEASAEKYRAIWDEGGSPLMKWSLALQKEVQACLEEPVLLGMRYGQPSLRDALREAKARGAARIVLAPLYPQFAEATSGSTIAHFRALAAEEGFAGEIRVFPAFAAAPFFARPLAEKIRARLKPESHLLLSFHGLPVKQLRGRHCGAEGGCERSLAENIACYRAHCLATARETARLLGIPPERWTMAFQSRFGRARWMGPHTEDLLKELPARGKADLVLAAPSFVADCLETLEELGLQGRHAFLAAGGRHFELVNCLNGDPAFARGLADAMRGQ